MLEIKNLHVKLEDEDKVILKGLTLTVPKGEVHAIMGPNGSGKSTLAYVLAGRDGYEVTEGDILWNGESILEMEPDERAAKGVFLAFQYPMEIPGVAGLTFLRTAANAVRKKRDEAELTTPEFMKVVKEKAAKLNIDFEMLKRPVNVGFSGGEKKRSESLTRCTYWPMAGSRRPAARSSRTNSRPLATPATPARRREDARGVGRFERGGTRDDRTDAEYEGGAGDPQDVRGQRRSSARRNRAAGAAARGNRCLCFDGPAQPSRGGVQVHRS
jgi:ABC-type lipoprotein export system ATPase subunit